MLKKLLKERFELFVKMRWLKTIEKETDKLHKLRSKTKRQRYVLRKLVEKYNELYREDPLTPESAPKMPQDA